MASSPIHVNEFDDLTECPICHDVFTDPSVLPCIHTFCLKCINGCCRGKRPGDRMACPLCRKEFSVPTGPDGFAKNVFIDKLSRIRELATNAKQQRCDVCARDSSNKSATFYCLGCQERLCESCKGVHCHMKATGSHRIVKLCTEMVQDKNIWKDMTTKCGTHEDKNLEIYCSTCKVAMCAMCFVEKHNTHKCTSLVKVSDEIRHQLTTSFGSLKNDECQGMLHVAAYNQDSRIAQICKAEKEICEQAERLKFMIETSKQKLLDDLRALKEVTLTEIGILSADIERQQKDVDKFRKYVSELLNKGTPCDIVQTSSGLLDKARELMAFNAFDTIARALECQRGTTIVFKPSSMFVHAPVTIGQLERFTKQPERQDAPRSKQRHVYLDC